MSLSHYSLKLISEECSNLLLKGRLEHIRQSGRNQMGFQFYVDSVRRDLLLDLQPAHNWLYLSTERFKSQTPDARVMLLRKHLKDQILVDWQQTPGDRVIVLHWGNGDKLVLELSGRHANLLLLDAQEIILLVWLPSHSQRLLHPAKRYQPPHPVSDIRQRDPFSLASLSGDGTRSSRLQQAHMVCHTLEQARVRVQAIDTILQRTHKKCQKEILRLNQDLGRLDESDQWKKRGELLQSAYGKVQKGQSEVELIDYYDPDQKMLVIALDPRLDLNQNIRQCFQRAKKRERAAEWALEKLSVFEARLNKVFLAQSMLSNLQAGLPERVAFSKPSLATCALDLPGSEWYQSLNTLEHKWLPQLSTQKKQIKSVQAASKLPYRRYWSLAGKEIRVGKKARDNDQLSFRLANGRDLWLHARNLSGSHVIVCLQKGEEVDEQTLLDAATLASYFSKAKGEHKTEVLYTTVKHLKKPKASADGQVLAANARSLILLLEPERLQRLLNQGKDLEPSEAL